MMTQCAIDEQTIAQSELEQYIQAQAASVSPPTPGDSFDALAQSTQNILAHALELSQQKENLSKTEYRNLLKQHGWKSEDKKYLNVATAFQQFSPQDLAQIEPATIFRLANNPKKYQSVIDELLDSPEITQATVRELITKQRPSEEPKSEQPSIWRRTRNGKRYCQIPPIHEQNEQTGTTLQHMMDSEGLTAQRIVAEAIALRQAYQEGRLILIAEPSSEEQQPDSGEEQDSSINTAFTELSSELLNDSGEEQDFDTAFTTESPLELLNTGGDEQDFDTASVNAVLDESEPKFDYMSGEDELLEDSWTYEPEPEKDDYVVDYGEFAVVTQPQEVSSTALSPVELLVETFQSATTWQEISEVLRNHEDFKQQAWDALTPTEKNRVMRLMPIELRKLSQAKKAGLIVEFKELRGGVYQIWRLGSLLPKVVTASSLETFLAQL